mmetsp:Transcript_52681/g.138996  ORF Transcript_52681/g.138996 Transcript_52681/m.138996 type:complete len:214 (+) Transcript_52681:716-1357(+)
MRPVGGLVRVVERPAGLVGSVQKPDLHKDDDRHLAYDADQRRVGEAGEVALQAQREQHEDHDTDQDDLPFRVPARDVQVGQDARDALAHDDGVRDARARRLQHADAGHASREDRPADHLRALLVRVLAGGVADPAHDVEGVPEEAAEEEDDDSSGDHAGARRDSCGQAEHALADNVLHDVEDRLELGRAQDFLVRLGRRVGLGLAGRVAVLVV